MIFISMSRVFIIAQNLVPNGNFEHHRPFDGSGLTIGSMTFPYDWKTINQPSTYCHKYFVKNFGQERLKRGGYINFDTLVLFEGDAMIELEYGENCPYPYADRDSGCASYIKTKLTSPLELGEIYEVTMWVYVKINPATDQQLYNHIGMYLTRREVIWKSSTRIPTDYFFFSEIEPGQWNEVKWYIRALCPLEYLIIGAFRDDEFPSLFRGDPANETPYYIDRVAINKVNEDSLSSEIHPTPYCEFYEKAEKEIEIESITAQNVHFESNLSSLDVQDKTMLDSFYQANYLRKHNIFIIIGHADSQLAENVGLSEARAQSIKQYLVQKYNIPKRSIITFGLGSADPVAENSTASGRYQNRRATIRTSDLVASQLVYRDGLDALLMNDLGAANISFSRWLRMVPFAQRIEMLGDPRLRKLKHSIYWNSLVAFIRKGYSGYAEPQNSFLLDSLFVEDQLFRVSNQWSFGGYIEEIDTVPPFEVKITEETIRQKDNSNFALAQEYFNTNGYPEISKVGRRPARGFGYVILHQGDSMVYVNTLPVLNKLAMEGEAEWDIYAKMADKLSVLKKEPQEYGTQYLIDSHGAHTLYKIDDIKEVNIRRAKIGMSPTAIPDN